MIKIVYNACFGGFSLSDLAMKRMAELGYVVGPYDSHREISRHDPRLVQVVEELGEDASGSCARLRIYTVYGTRYKIKEYDGNETVQEQEDDDYIYID